MTADYAFSSIGHCIPRVTGRSAALVLLGLALLGLTGCQRTGTASATAGSEGETQPAESIWEVYYLQGAKIGYGHTTVTPTSKGDRELVKTDALNHLSITRFGQTTEQNLEMSTIETPAGELVEFKTVVAFGSAPTVVSGKVEGPEMAITTETQGRKETSRIPWNSDIRGFRAVEQSLAEAPPKPGEQRSFKMLVPLVNQVADVTLAAKDVEPTKVLGVEVRLLRIESAARLPGGQAIDSTVWTDEQGQVIKTHVAALQQESFRTTADVAQAPATGGGQLDLGLDLFVKVEPPLQRPHETREVVYKIELADGDPAKVFAIGPTQSVKSLGPHLAEVTVRSVRPGDPAEKPAQTETPGPEYTAANSVLQLDDARLKQMAAEGKGTATKPHEIALALEHYVHGAVREKNFSHGFATAAEVAENQSGDCTEHAVLLAALARICGLPSRVAIGLVYVDRAAGFGYHMWTEVFLDGRWVPLDGINGAGGTSAAYLKLNDSSLSGASAYSSFLSVAQVLGQLKISVVSAK